VEAAFTVEEGVSVSAKQVEPTQPRAGRCNCPAWRLPPANRSSNHLIDLSQNSYRTSAGLLWDLLIRRASRSSKCLLAVSLFTTAHRNLAEGRSAPPSLAPAPCSSPNVYISLISSCRLSD